MKRLFSYSVLLVATLLGACGDELGQVTRLNQEAPPGAPPGTCWGKIVTPALVETVTLQVLVRDAVRGPDGALLEPAQYRTESRQDIVREREERFFETPCPEVMTEEFTANLQRALDARGYYGGTATGVMDAETRAAILRYQSSRGLETTVLSLDAARALGLVAIARET